MLAQIVYLLCAFTSVGCAILLFRSYFRQRARLLLWSGLCFAFLGLSNILLFVDLIVVPQTDLSALRHTVTLIGMAMLLYGLIWETN
jgi:hypothetical protein